ncbi:MAG: DNA double-strand break repair nuclease NurA [Peptoniphilus harei]|uniref:DNA double-strand break repair nuclease NurA n=1 Tax=Peptoniphilus harei TaxID=54005 RepID=UPI002904D104|nr:DNA double-strand break repair nuclease NurA [Peptoniphilus harei]MDU1643648.1 DNA double-strand break repair nuclease NurA [Peptoniphilus harei]MDU2373607.1 DNA double-strand break repair nuclease NurA [Peptoniphilus harei]MDU3086499.1 DNA double-strand break repair nuclease NurA [Peptoniphilus harei]
MINLQDLEGQLKEVNTNLKNKYDFIFNLDKDAFRKELTNNVGRLIKMEKFPKEKLSKYKRTVGVDGSNNRSGGAFPHFIEIFQGLAKSTDGNEIYKNKVYTPTLNDIYDDKNLSQKYLATIEIETALEYIDEYDFDYLMMDGGFIRYKINCLDLFTELREKCEAKNIILFGVIKDLKTNVIARSLEIDESIYDREILFNRLITGEALLIRNEINKKFIKDGLGEGFSSAFMRTAKFPGAVGLDILDTQEKYLEEIASLVYTLTPMSSRGVPLWLDIVDKDVKITDEILTTLLEEYLDRDVYERFFISERDKRTL